MTQICRFCLRSPVDEPRATLLISLVRQNQFSNVFLALERMGVSAERLVERMRLPHWEYADPEDVVPTEHMLRLIEAGARATGDNRIGILVGANARFDKSIGRYGRILASSMTVFDVLTNASRLASAHSSTLRFWLESTDDGCWFCRKNVASFGGLDVGMAQHEQLSITAMRNMVRLGANKNWQVPEARLEFTNPANLPDWPEIGAAALDFEQSAAAIFVPRDVLILPVQHAEAISMSDAETDMQLAWLGDDFIDSVRSLMRSALSIAQVDLRVICEILGTSSRTLQRRLTKEGTSFRELMSQARFQRSTELLMEPDLTAAEISDRLGYENQQHFTRAFKRWAGVAPTAYRNLADSTGAERRYT